jgi:hypothetical protein
MHVDDRLLLLEGNIGQATAIRRPDRRNDRLARGQRRGGVLAIGIGNLQQELAARLDHVGDAGRENAFFAGQLFVNVIGNAMAGRAQLRIAGHVGSAAQRHALLRVVQTEAGFHAAIGTARDAAGGQRIGTAPLPVGMVDRGIFIKGQAGVIDHLEQAAALQIAAHGGGDDARRGRIAGKSTMATGMRLAPAPVISMDSWAWAKPAAHRATARKIRREIRDIAVIFRKFRAILLFKRTVFDFQRALEKRGIIRLGQGRRFADCRLDCGPAQRSHWSA